MEMKAGFHIKTSIRAPWNKRNTDDKPADSFIIITLGSRLEEEIMWVKEITKSGIFVEKSTEKSKQVELFWMFTLG